MDTINIIILVLLLTCIGYLIYPSLNIFSQQWFTIRYAKINPIKAWWWIYRNNAGNFNKALLHGLLSLIEKDLLEQTHLLFLLHKKGHLTENEVDEHCKLLLTRIPRIDSGDNNKRFGVIEIGSAIILTVKKSSSERDRWYKLNGRINQNYKIMKDLWFE